MFGQQPFGTPTTQASGFGGSTFGASPFGAPTANVFGQPQQPSQPFGATNTFGSTAFGQPQQQQMQQQQQSNPFASTGSTFGGTTFGGQQQQPQATPVFGGGTGLFGATQPMTQTQPLFGSTQPQQQQTTGLFGSASTTGGLFGQPAKPAFGAATTFGAAAQPQQTTSMFGQPMQQQQSTGLFGSTAGTSGTGLFGQQSSSNMFGMSNAGSQSGTTIKFSPSIGTDTVMKNNIQSTITTKNFSICSMKEYDEKKSMEELRLEDYAANRKYGTPSSTSSTSTMFGQQQTGSTGGTGLFGGSTSGFGGGFGAAKPSGFGGGGLFGSTSATSQPTTGLFGQPAAQPPPTGGLFGSTGFGAQPAASAASSFSFNTTPAAGTTSGFGAFGQQQQQNKPMFGSTFGQPAATSTASTGLFGQSAFGAPAQSTSGFGGFGAQTSQAPAFKPFGAPATTTAPSAFGGFGTGSVFGAKPTTTTSLFGTTTSTTSAFSGFGSTTPFGQPAQPAQTSLFGAKPTTGFGTSTTTQPSAFGGFGSFGQSSGGGLFGSAQPALQQASSPQSPSGNVHAQIIELMRKGSSDTDVLSNMYAKLPVKDDKKPAPLSKDAINSFISNAQKTYSSGGSARNDNRGVSYYVAQPQKETGFTLSTSNGPLAWRTAAAKRDERFRLDRAYIAKLESEIADTRQDTPRPAATKVAEIRSKTYSTSKPSGGFSRSNSAKESPVEVVDFNKEINREDSSPLTQVRERTSQSMRDDEELKEREYYQNGNGQAVFTSTRSDYFTIPDVSELELDERGMCFVQDFYIGRNLYGGVRFPGKTNVAGLDLDSIVSIEDKEVSIYPQEDQKPAVGKGLNKKAVIMFENVKPNMDDGEEMTSQQIMDSGFVELLKARVEIMDDAEFLGYNPETFQLSFAVKHFSKYKLILDEADARNRFGKRGMKSSFGTSPAKRLSPLIPSRPVDLHGSLSDNSRDSLKENETPSVGAKEFHLRNVLAEDSIFCEDMDGFYETAVGDEEEAVEMGGSLIEAEETGRVVVASHYASIGKSAIGSISSGADGSAIAVSGSGSEFLGKCYSEDPAMSYDSKILLEEMFELYICRCQFSMQEDSSVIHPPQSRSRFLEDLCALADSLIDPSSTMVYKKILFDLLKVLHLSAIAEDQCEAFIMWLKTSVSLLYSEIPVCDIKPENASRAIFQSVLCSNFVRASEIAQMNGLYTVAAVIDVIASPEEREDPEHSAVLEYVKETCDQFLADDESRNTPDVVYLIKTFMLLSGTLCLTNDEGDILYSIFQGLNWMECLAACTLHMNDLKNPPTGIWDFVRRYQDHCEWNSDCVLPSSTDPVPTFIFDMILHFCRHSIPMNGDGFDTKILSEGDFDVRVRWFVAKIQAIFDDPIDVATDLQLTSDFSRLLTVSGFPHLSVVALLHLEPNLGREHEIRAVLHSLAKPKMASSAMLESVIGFLSDDLGISASFISEAKAVVSVFQGKKLEAVGHYFHAGQRTLCLELISTYILPLLASCDRPTYSKTLDAITFTGTSNDLVEPYTSFLEMLQVVERIKLGNMEQETFQILDALMDRLIERKDEFSDLESQSYLILGFVNRKLREGRAFLDLWETDDLPER